MTKTEELLKVLDLPNVEQHKWLRQYAIENKLTEQHVWKWFIIATGNGEIDAVEFTDNMAIAGLAFRLRDEVSVTDWSEGLLEVYKYERKRDIERYEEGCPFDCRVWSYQFAQPIHWIVASLIAKEEKP